MSDRFRPPWSGAGLALLAVMAGASSARAQSCPEGSCDFTPTVTFLSTYSGTTSSYEVEVSHADYEKLNPSTRKLSVNGTVVATGTTGTVTYVPSGGPDYTQMTTKNTVTLSAGTNTVRSEICDVPVLSGATQQCTFHTQTVTYTPPPATVARDTPQMSIAPHSTDHGLITATQVALGYATPAYVSMDQARSVSLFYTGAQANPRGFVQVDATDNTTDAVLYMSILVKGSDGTTVAPERFYAVGKGANRLASAWDMSIWQSGVYPFTVVVRTHYSTTDFREATLPVSVAVVNEASSPLGRGWALSGYQRLHDEGNGMSVIENGFAQLFTRVGGCVPCRHTAPVGEYSVLSWDTVAGSFYRMYPDSTRVFFHSTYRVATSIVDRFGNTTTFEHDPTYARVTGVVDAAGKRTTLAYDGSNRLTTITDPGGRVSRFYYTSGQLDSIRDPGNTRALRVTYNGTYVAKTWDRNGAETAYTHDYHKTVSSVVAPSLTDNTLNKPTTQLRSLLTAVLPDSGKGTTTVLATRVIPDSVRATATDPVGALVRVAMDRFGNPLRVEAPYGSKTVITRDAAGNVVKTVGPSGGFAVNNVDVATGRSFGNDVYAPEGVQTSGVLVTYDTSCKEQPKEVRRGNHVTTFTYTPRCQVATVNAGMGTTTYTYETDGRVKTVTDPTGAVTTMYYAATGWENTDSVRVSTTAGVQRTKFTYDGLGRSASTTGPTNLTTWVQYDTLNRVVRTTNAAGKATLFAYTDGLQSRVQVTDPANKVYAQRFNALGWLVADSAAAGKRLHAYDLGGRDTAVTNRRTQVVRVAYDSVGRPTRRIAPAHIAGVLADTTTWTYDNPNGRFVVVANRESRDSLFTIPSTRTSGHAAQLTGVTGRWTVTSVLNSLGLRQSVKVTSPAAVDYTASYGYNTKGQLTRVTDLEGQNTTVAYDTYGRPSKLTYPTTMVRDFSYTPRSLSASDAWGDPDINDALGLGSLEYDALNRNVRRSRPDPILDNTNLIRRFAYDSIGQLLSARDSTVTSFCEMDEETMQVVCGEDRTQDRAFTYAYDLVGNRTDGGATMVSNSNRYATFGGYTFEYDADGNVTRKYKSGFEQRYRWSALGQLRAVVTNGDSVDYGYNGLGVRVRRTRSATTVHSLYDGANLIAELGGTVKLFTHFPGVDAPHSMFVPGTSSRYFYVNEYPGHVRGMFDEANDLAGAYAYDPFGADSTGGPGDALGNPFRFMSREMDPNNGLYYVRARWYDPGTQRFASEDPIGLQGGINLYSYVENDPINLTDPSGLCPLDKLSCIIPIPGICVGGLCGMEDLYQYAAESYQRAWLEGHVGLQGGGGRNRGLGVSFGAPMNPDQAQYLAERFAEFGRTVKPYVEQVNQCIENNSFSNYFFSEGSPVASLRPIAEFVEISGPAMMVADGAAIVLKRGGGKLGSGPNASGVNEILRKGTRAVGRFSPGLQRRLNAALLRGTGKLLGPIVSGAGAFTVGWNNSVEWQCILTVLE